MIRQATQAGSTVLMLVAVLGPGTAAAHGNVAIEEDACVRRVGGHMVHFSAYQPQFKPKAEYCTEIPDEGDTFLVVDLVDQALRNVPVGVQVVRVLSETEAGQTVAGWRPVTHPDGVVEGEARLDEGVYKLIITAEGLSPSYYLLRVHKIDYSQLARSAVGPLTLLLLLTVVGYEVSKSKRVRKLVSFLSIRKKRDGGRPVV